MQKATATYVAPPGDSKVVEMGGVTFFDGKPVELNSYDHAHMIAKLPGNPHFDVKVEKDDGEVPTVAKKRGRPSNADIAAAKEAAAKAEEDAKIASAKAKEAKADADALTKDVSKPQAAQSSIFASQQTGQQTGQQQHNSLSQQT